MLPEFACPLDRFAIKTLISPMYALHHRNRHRWRDTLFLQPGRVARGLRRKWRFFASSCLRGKPCPKIHHEDAKNHEAFPMKRKLLSEEDKTAVAQAIKKAETVTSGEIVFALTDASAMYRHAIFQGALPLPLLLSRSRRCLLPAHHPLLFQALRRYRHRRKKSRSTHCPRTATRRRETSAGFVSRAR